jgi:hypothetical protein
MLPEPTEDAALPPDVMVNVVVVAAGAAPASRTPAENSAKAAAERNDWRKESKRMNELQSRPLKNNAHKTVISGATRVYTSFSSSQKGFLGV